MKEESVKAQAMLAPAKFCSVGILKGELREDPYFCLSKMKMRGTEYNQKMRKASRNGIVFEGMKEEEKNG
jgi:hypothetical protein